MIQKILATIFFFFFKSEHTDCDKLTDRQVDSSISPDPNFAIACRRGSGWGGGAGVRGGIKTSK